MTGMIKWFNSKSGFGFITVYSDNEYKGNDIFVHYSAIRSTNSQYKYLVQGEYVDFDLAPSESGDHKFVARDVAGVFGGPIMCETRKIALQQQQQSTHAHVERTYKLRDSADDGFARVPSRNMSARQSSEPARPSRQNSAPARQNSAPSRQNSAPSRQNSAPAKTGVSRSATV